MNDCQVLILTIVIITTLNASTGKFLTVTTQHKLMSRDIKIVSEAHASWPLSGYVSV